jgi:LSD1 subclass zinc finger protein
MSLEVACISCRRPFDADLHAGLVRCAPCEDMHQISFPSSGATVIVLDTPGEAWA